MVWKWAFETVKTFFDQINSHHPMRQVTGFDDYRVSDFYIGGFWAHIRDIEILNEFHNQSNTLSIYWNLQLRPEETAWSLKTAAAFLITEYLMDQQDFQMWLRRLQIFQRSNFEKKVKNVAKHNINIEKKRIDSNLYVAQILTFCSFAALWATRMHSISFESSCNLWVT